MDHSGNSQFSPCSHMMLRSAKALSLIACISLASACGGGGGSSDDDTPPMGDTCADLQGADNCGIEIIGKVTIPDGTTPVANATIYVAGTPAAGSAKPIVGTDCETPPVSFVAATCTNGDGSFNLAGLDAGEYEISVLKGAFTRSFTADTTGAESSVTIAPVALSTDVTDGGAKIAVITGVYDSIQNVIAKSGFGDIDTQGYLVLGSESFDIYQGHSDSALEDNYPSFPSIFEDDPITQVAKIYDYDIVFINCGVFESNDAIGVDPEDPDIRATMRDYVESGGRLYVTDQAYDFVEQTFPEFIDFYDPNGENADADIFLPEQYNAAEDGEGQIIVEEAGILDDILREYLSAVSCGADNDEACTNGNGTMHVEGFLSSWAVMNGPHGSATDVTVHTEGEVSTTNEDNVIKPLMVSFNVGEGRVFYSSYHTEDTGFEGFLPQERTLQYLIFE